MHDLRRRATQSLIGLLCGAAFFAAPARAAFISSTCQICQEGNNCETGATVTTPGQLADMSRFWTYTSDGFAFAAAASVATEYAGFSAFARGSGSHNPPGQSSFINLVSRGGSAYGNFNDTITAGSGGGTGFLRLPLHLVGTTSVSWQNGFGSAGLGISCQSYEPGAIVTLGPCTGASLTFTNDTVIDQIVNIDIPILLGSPVTYTVSVVAGAASGYAYGNAVPFAGQAEITVGTLPFAGAIVLDASRQPIPGATVSIGESGFDYQAAPEASSWLGTLAALSVLPSLRGRSRTRAFGAAR